MRCCATSALLQRAAAAAAAATTARPLVVAAARQAQTTRRTAAARATSDKGSEPADVGTSGGDGDGDGDETPLVTVAFRGRAVRVARGTRLRTALLENGLTPHNGRAQLINCRGLGTCGTCAVRLTAGAVDPPAWTAAERLRLNFPPHRAPGSEALRLACQVTCESDLVVAKCAGFWGQHTDAPPLPDLAEEGGGGNGEAAAVAPPPLGELEYVLDATRRRQRQQQQQQRKQ